MRNVLTEAIDVTPGRSEVPYAQGVDGHVVEDIVRYIDGGLPPSTAAMLLGVTRHTFHTWLRSGMEAIALYDKGETLTTRQDHLARLVVAVEQADAAAHEKLLGKLTGCIDDLLDHDDPKAKNDGAKLALQMLTKRWWKNWGQRSIREEGASTVQAALIRKGEAPGGGGRTEINVYLTGDGDSESKPKLEMKVDDGGEIDETADDLDAKFVGSEMIPHEKDPPESLE
jgi:hypothetical protein